MLHPHVRPRSPLPLFRHLARRRENYSWIVRPVALLTNVYRAFLAAVSTGVLAMPARLSARLPGRLPGRLPAGLAMVLAVVAGQAASASAAPDCPSGALTIGTDATFPPFTSKVGDQYVGLEIELGEKVAEALGCKVNWVNSSFDGIFPALLAGKYDFVIASVTITDERKKSMLFSEPYVDAGQSIAVRRESPPIADLDGLRGKKVGVGLNTTGQFLMEPVKDVTLVKFPSVDLALADLRNKRLDAAVGDGPVFRYMIAQSFPDLVLTGAPLNQEQWGMAFRPGTEALLGHVNEVIRRFHQDGTLKRLEAKFLESKGNPSTSGSEGVPGAIGGSDGSGAVAISATASSVPVAGSEASSLPPAPVQGAQFRMDRFVDSIPLFFKGARWTVGLSLASFFLAVPLGLLIALARLSRLKLLNAPAAAYVEVLRGTPLLVQIFFIYFVLPNVGLSLADQTTAILALSINASAYISEIFRAGLLSIDSGQNEAALALGLTRTQSLRFVLVPQAIRRVVPPLTNECIALIKDSSLVSVMGMTELTRTGQELASRYADPLTIWPGVALTYFILTFPLTRLSARLENRLAQGQHRDADV